MGIGTGSAALIGGLGAAGSIGSAAIGANAAGNASAAQQAAANKAAGIQEQGSNNALNYQNAIYGQEEQNLSPWLQAGGGAESELSNLLGISPNASLGGTVAGAQGLNPSTAGGGLSNNVAQPTSNMNSIGSQVAGGTPGGAASPFGGAASTTQLPAGATPQSGAMGATTSLGGATSAMQLPAGSSGAAPTGGSAPGYGSLLSSYPGGAFQAPTAQQALNSPGEQAQLQLGETALQKSAAAGGNALTGGEGMALENYAQNLASTNYQSAYGNALNTYGTNYGVWNNQQNNDYSRLMGLSSSGQSAANSLSSAGQASSNNVTNNLLGTGGQIGADYGAQGAASASGTVGAANAWGGGLSNTTGNLSNLLLLSQLQGAGGGGGAMTVNPASLPSGINQSLDYGY